MTPNSNNDNEINVYCDWLTDNGYQNLADEIRFEYSTTNCWCNEFKCTRVGSIFGHPYGSGQNTVSHVGAAGWRGTAPGSEAEVGE